MSEFDWVERDRGILTKRDRRFLRGDLNEELNKNQSYQKRYQIRKRIRNAMFDFHIIYRALPNRDIGMLWDEIDYWISQSQRERERGDAPPYPEIPHLGHCWRDLIALFVYSQISTGIAEARLLTKWVIEEGVNKAIRRHNFEYYNSYQEVDSSLDWETGDSYKSDNYLQSIVEEMPGEPDAAENYLLELQRGGFLLSHHVTHVYEKHVED